MHINEKEIDHGYIHQNSLVDRDEQTTKSIWVLSNYKLLFYVILKNPCPFLFFIFSKNNTQNKVSLS